MARRNSARSTSPISVRLRRRAPVRIVPVSARRLLGIVCLVVFWATGRFIGEFYPYSHLGMFDHPATVASRLFVRDAAGEAREIGRYEAWRCDGPLDFTPSGPPSCTGVVYSAFEDIARDFIVSHPATDDDAGDREVLEITRRVFRIPNPTGPVEINDCPLLRCTARQRSGQWTPSL